MPSGPKNELVGISHECDYPPGGGRLSVLTRPRKALARRSSDIDREVREILRDALAVYEIELERLRAARPDVVVTPDLCDVCAVSIDDVHRRWSGSPAKTWWSWWLAVSPRGLRTSGAMGGATRLGRRAARKSLGCRIPSPARKLTCPM